jgi:hypothetical protein
MRDICVVLSLTLSLLMCAAAQDDSPKPKVSDDPLTAEQIAIYRVVVQDYTKGSDGVLNLADRTEPLERSAPLYDQGCTQGIELDHPKNSNPIIHKLDPSIAHGAKMVWVDPDRQQRQIENNDPQKLLKKAIDDHDLVTDEQLAESVKNAFGTGVFTLSEIAFDKQHTRAVVAYSFVCGELCGHGNILLLKRVGQKWKVSKKCGGWVS